METLRLTWSDGENWACAWTCSPDGSVRRWFGFVRLDDECLRALGAQAQTEIKRHDLNSVVLHLPAGATAVGDPCRLPRGTRRGAPSAERDTACRSRPTRERES